MVIAGVCMFLLLASLLFTHLIRLAAIRHNIIDIPNQRSSHDTPTPRGGGLAIVISWFIGISVLFFLNLIEQDLFLAFLPGILLAVAGFIDDIYSVKPIIRLLIQFLTAGIAFYLLGGIDPVKVGTFEISSVFILYPVTVTGIVWFINLFNFLDGTDGYSSLEAITMLVVMYIFSNNSVNLILIASVAGFLYWNWPKAKIFMGDIGSTQLGFILVVLGIYFHNNSQISIIHWLMISSLFWFDATLTLIRRWRNKEVLSVAHRKHAYQRAVQAGLTHKQLLFVSFFVNAGIFGLVILSKRINHLILPAFLINVVVLYVLTQVVDRKIPFNYSK